MPDAMNLADPKVVCGALGIPEPPAEWTETWPRSQPAPDEGRPSFLTPDVVEEVADFVCLGPGTRQVFREALPAFEENPAAARLARHCAWLLFASGDAPKLDAWPRLSREAFAAADMFYAFVILVAGTAHVRRLHAERGIDEEVTRETLKDIEIWMEEHRKLHGRMGLGNLGWTAKHVTGGLYQLGRLQFDPAQFSHPFRAYRHRSGQPAVLLVEDGRRLRADGQFADADKGARADASDNWTAALKAGPDVIEGHPADPHGFVRREAVRLPAAEWDETLRPDDPILFVHIPATGPMTPEACADSFRRAKTFFAEHFPELEWRAFVSRSWLFDPQLEEHLPPEKNIVRFLQEWYLHPVPGADDAQTLERVFGFGVTEIDPDRAPQETSLQKTVVAHIRAGGCWREGGSLLFPADLDWGSRVYRRMDPDALPR